MFKKGVWLLVSLLLSTTLSAQTDTGSITGTVRDETGGVLPGVKVTVTNMKTGMSVETVTNDTGIYVATPLRIGFYQITAELPGFKREIVRGIEMRVQDRVAVDLTLKVGEVIESVEVIAAAPLLETETSSIGQVVDNRTITELPLPHFTDPTARNNFVVSPPGQGEQRSTGLSRRSQVL